MDADTVNDICILAGFICAITSFGLLYLSATHYNSCVIDSFGASIKGSKNNQTFDVNIVGTKLSDCQKKTLSMDPTLVAFGIAGLTTPIISPNVISIYKKHSKFDSNGIKISFGIPRIGME